MHLTNIGKVLCVPDLDLLTAHGALQGVVHSWKEHDLLADPSVKALLSPSPGQGKALDEARHIVTNAISILCEITMFPAAIARFGASLLCDNDLLDGTAVQDHNDLSQHAPTISLALQALGARGTF